MTSNKEPKGVDFVINGKPLTEKQKIAISQYIKEDKASRSNSDTVKIPKKEIVIS